MKKHNHKNNNSKTVVGARTCFVCKTIALREDMLRFVARSGQVVQFSLFQMPAGAFIVFGLILAVLAFIKNRKAEKKAALEKLEKQRKAEEAKKAAAAAAAQTAVEGGNK